jgi:8-hydroxy-5-deazaflavin:NADPH oxidoreductase
MKIAVLGTGDVGKAIGKGFIELGHDVMMGARSATSEKAQAWAKDLGPRASSGSFADAAELGEIVVLCTLGVANEEALAQAGPERLAGKLVIDTTNPLDFSRGFPPSLAVSGTDSGGERVQRQVPGAHVVKAWNTVGHHLMFHPVFTAGRPDMFICGNDDAAKGRVTELLREVGWDVIDLGGIEASRHLEAMCMVWVLAAARTGDWNRAFKLLRKE